MPQLAGAHRERMDGKGCPYGLGDDAIPLPARIMAADRPYERALGRDETLAILDRDARDGHLDSRLVEAFVEGRCFEVDLESSLRASRFGRSRRCSVRSLIPRRRSSTISRARFRAWPGCSSTPRVAFVR